MQEKVNKWFYFHNLRLVIFNMAIVFLFLLRSAGYFSPYFPISVNFIVMFAVVLSIFLLNTNSKIIFFVALFFWIFAGLLQILHIGVWAERTGIYAYETLFVALILFLVETLSNHI